MSSFWAGQLTVPLSDDCFALVSGAVTTTSKTIAVASGYANSAAAAAQYTISP